MKLNSNTPEVIVVDGFYAEPMEVRSFALKQEFNKHPNDHKGWRSAAHRFPGVKERFEQLLGLRITKWEEHGYCGVFNYCIGGDPIVYHTDRQSHAAVVYLSPDAPPESGTRLIRSKATKLRKVNETTVKPLGLSLPDAEKLVFGGKLLDPTAWEVVDVIGNVFNRCVIWDAKLLHAAGAYFGTGLHDGRLTQIFFFDAEPLPKGWPQPSPNMPLAEFAKATVEVGGPTPVRTDAVTPEAMMAQAKTIVQLHLGMSAEQQRVEMTTLKGRNPVLHQIVKSLKEQGSGK